MMEDHAKQKAAMTPPEPQTAAGRALLDAYGRAEYSDGALRLAILAIEAEAQLIGFDDAWNKAEADSEALRAALAGLLREWDENGPFEVNEYTGGDKVSERWLLTIEQARAALTPEAARHYPTDDCGDPQHDAILAAWYANAEKLLKTSRIDVERLARALEAQGAIVWAGGPHGGPVVDPHKLAEYIAAAYLSTPKEPQP
jgi:hypothetical protein